MVESHINLPMRFNTESGWHNQIYTQAKHIVFSVDEVLFFLFCISPFLRVFLLFLSISSQTFVLPSLYLLFSLRFLIYLLIATSLFSFFSAPSFSVHLLFLSINLLTSIFSSSPASSLFSAKMFYDILLNFLTNFQH